MATLPNVVEHPSVPTDEMLKSQTCAIGPGNPPFSSPQSVPTTADLVEPSSYSGAGTRADTEPRLLLPTKISQETSITPSTLPKLSNRGRRLISLVTVSEVDNKGREKSVILEEMHEQTFFSRNSNGLRWSEINPRYLLHTNIQDVIASIDSSGEITLSTIYMEKNV